MYDIIWCHPTCQDYDSESHHVLLVHISNDFISQMSTYTKSELDQVTDIIDII